MFWDRFLHKPAPQIEVRYVVATRQESLAAAIRRNNTNNDLLSYVERTTPEQRRAETEAYIERMREQYAGGGKGA